VTSTCANQYPFAICFSQFPGIAVKHEGSSFMANAATRV